jgi:predicted glycosyltransferase
MNILIDINHPAHVHYFRNAYKRWIKDGHNVTVVSRNKEIEQLLLGQYGIEFISRGKGAQSVFGKIIYQVYAVSKLLLIIKRQKIDKIISFMHPYGAQAAWLLGKKSILFSDTENANLHHKMSVPFATEVHTPECFERDLGDKHSRFKGFMELSYLHPNYFTPDRSILEQLNLTNDKPITVVRFVSWGAVHDIGHTGITEQDKIALVQKLSEVSNVFISSEGELPDELKEFELKIDKTKIHSLLHFSNLFIGESATMASESAMLGTPAIYLDNEGRGYTNHLEKEYGIVFNFKENSENVSKATDMALSILKLDKNKYKKISEQILKENIDTSEYIYNQIIKYSSNQ